jgi:hypothetical protein
MSVLNVHISWSVSYSWSQWTINSRQSQMRPYDTFRYAEATQCDITVTNLQNCFHVFFM